MKLSLWLYLEYNQLCLFNSSSKVESTIVFTNSATKPTINSSYYFKKVKELLYLAVPKITLTLCSTPLSTRDIAFSSRLLSSSHTSLTPLFTLSGFSTLML